MKIIKIRFFWDFEKEEKWINAMAQKGYNLIDYFWIRYVFEKTEPNEYHYQIIFLPKRVKTVESINYIAFLEENGYECVATYMYWAYFRCLSNLQTEIYSDLKDRLNHYKRISRFWLVLIMFEVGLAIFEIICGIIATIKSGELAILYFIGGLIILLFSIFFSIIRHRIVKKGQKLKRESFINE